MFYFTKSERYESYIPTVAAIQHLNGAPLNGFR